MGWEIRVERLGLQRHPAGRVRTYGTYQVLIDGHPVTSLFGHICECTGPGNNFRGSGTRIEQGRYALSTQFDAHYRSVGFTNDARFPYPAILVLGTGDRKGILISPAHSPALYISSIGCFNPTKALKANENMSFLDSRERLMDILKSLGEYDPVAFASGQVGRNTPISEAFIVIDGEPANYLGD